MRRRNEETIIEYRGFGASGVLTAFMVGAAAGATLLYLNGAGGDENRERLRRLADGTREALGRLPGALRKAREAARDAFNQTVTQTIDEARATGALGDATAPSAPFSG